MPVTPFHIGAGLFFKAYAPARVSWVVFALVNILIDLEPILWYLLTGDPAHRQLHSYIGAAVSPSSVSGRGECLRKPGCAGGTAN